MKITFLGATQEVTGSKYLVENADTKILVDCGLFQGEEAITKHNWDPFPIEPSSIDAVVLTHAHIDHSGYIPVLVKNGFRGKIYCSKATYALSAILLLDSGLLQEEDAQRINDHRTYNSPVEPLYTADDAEYALQFFDVVDYDTLFSIGSLQITLIRCSHILGASFVVISDGKQTLTFSGDLGRPHPLIMKAPTHLTHTDFLVIESTYGNRVHAESDTIKDLGKIVNKAIAKGGVILIPCFAVGRTQSILYCLYQLKQKKVIPDIPIFLDSPMAISVTNLFCNFPDEYTLSPQVCAEVCNSATDTLTVKESKHIDHIKGPVIIIAGSGMANGGRILDHFKYFISGAKNTIIFVGYQAKGTHGRELVDGASEIKIYGKTYPVHAEIKIIDTLSAHADSNEILEWLSYFKGTIKKLFITHGQLMKLKHCKRK